LTGRESQLAVGQRLGLRCGLAVRVALGVKLPVDRRDHVDVDVAPAEGSSRFVPLLLDLVAGPVHGSADLRVTRGVPAARVLGGVPAARVVDGVLDETVSLLALDRARDAVGRRSRGRVTGPAHRRLTAAPAVAFPANLLDVGGKPGGV
jgi:hypothetical protein